MNLGAATVVAGLISFTACAGRPFADIGPDDLKTDSHFFLGGSPEAVLSYYGEPIRRDTINHGMGVVHVVWHYPAQEFTFWRSGSPFEWRITGPGPTTDRGLGVGMPLARAHELYGDPSRVQTVGSVTWVTFVMPPNWYPQYGIAVESVADTIRSITVGELVFVVM